jgi:hypothetical protein
VIRYRLYPIVECVDDRPYPIIVSVAAVKNPNGDQAVGAAIPLAAERGGFAGTLEIKPEQPRA